MKKILFLLLIVNYSCKTLIIPNDFDNAVPVVETKNTSIPNGATVLYFIRHAENLENGSRNPDLSLRGKQRAKRYATYFKDKKLTSIYTTNFKRTAETAAIVSENNGLEFEYYNPSQVEVKEVLENNKGKHILFVGHSNTVPKSVNSFIGKMKYTQMMEDQYDEIYRVVVTYKKTYDDVLLLSQEIKAINELNLMLLEEKMKNKKKLQRKQKRNI